MPPIRGLVLMSRLEYLERRFGTETHRNFLKKISTENLNFIKQPLEGAMSYPDTILGTIDQLLFEDFFDRDAGQFKELGKWSAENFMYRFFSQYVDERKPVEFLSQYGRLRYYLIGAGEMLLQPVSADRLNLSIDYGQKIPKSVCLSEQGFIEGGLEQCGAKQVVLREDSCASTSEDFTCHFSVRFKIK
jgi:hypothetical protein